MLSLMIPSLRLKRLVNKNIIVDEAVPFMIVTENN